VLESEATWRLAQDALERLEGNAPPWRLPYDDIAELRLNYDPTRFETNRFRCTARPALMQGPALISSPSRA
jgi:hypothetical protein